MNNLDWDDLRFFLAAARSGSLSAASRVLGSNQPTVGRRIAALEQAVGCALFQRHPQGLTLTPEGRQIMKAADAMEQIAGGVSRVAVEGEPLAGPVRIAAPEGLAFSLIAPALSGFAETHPGVDLVLQPAVGSADLLRGEADIAIRLYRPETADLVVRQLGQMEFGLYAADEYLERYGVPYTVEDLRGHRFISYGPQLESQEDHVWLLATVPQARVVFASDSTLTRLSGAEAGIGIASLPVMIAEPRLRRVAANLSPPARTIWMVVHRDLRESPRVRTVLDFLGDVIIDALQQYR